MTMTSLSHVTAYWFSPVSVANELPAQHSNTWLMLVVAVCSTLQKPPTFPSSTCIDLLWGDHVCYGGYSCYMCSSSISYMLIAACCGCNDSSKSRYLLYSAKNKYITMSISPRVVMTEIDLYILTKGQTVIMSINFRQLFMWNAVPK